MSAGLVYQIAKSLYSCEAGTVALVVFLLYPVNLYTAGMVYPQAFTEMLLLAAIYITIRTRGEEGILFIGIIFTMLVMTVPNFLIAFVLILAYLVASHRSKSALIYAAISLLILTATIGAWSWRNYTAFGEVVFISSNSGLNLLLGNSEHSGPNTGVNVDINVYLEGASHMDEAEADNFYREKAIEWIKNNFDSAAILFCKKLTNWFNFSNELLTNTESSNLKDLIVAFTFYPLLFFAISGSFLGRKLSENRDKIYITALFWAIYLTAAIIYAIFFTRIRFRVPYDAILIILASPYILWLINALLSQWRRLFRKRPRNAVFSGMD